MDIIKLKTTATQQVTSDQLDALAHDYLDVPLTLDDSTVGVHKDASVDISGMNINVTDGVYTDTKEAVEAKDATVTGTELIRILDPNVLSVLLSNMTVQYEGKITKSEAEACTSLPALAEKTGSASFYNNTSIVKFNELGRFTNVHGLPRSCFFGCTNLEEVDVSNITSFPTNALRNCTKITKLTYSDKLTSIGDHSHMSLSITQVKFPASLTSISTDAYSGCSKLTKVVYDSLGKLLNISFSNSVANPLYYAKHLYFSDDPDTEVTEITIPDGTTAIKQYVFTGGANLTKITIPSTVTSIGAGAFYDCSSWVGEVAIPDGQTSVGDYTFYNCKSLTKITIPDTVTTIGTYAFYNCSSLSKITIPENITSINSYTFQGCKNADFDLSHVKTIAVDAFAGCSNMSCRDFSNLTSTGDWGSANGVFNGCSKVLNWYLPKLTSNGGATWRTCTFNYIFEPVITSVGQYSYVYSTGNVVDIGKLVTSFRMGCFYGAKVTSLIVRATTPPDNPDKSKYDIKYNGYFSTYLFVPSGSVDSYKESETWDSVADRTYAIGGDKWVEVFGSTDEYADVAMYAADQYDEIKSAYENA